jgi:hypothetical protein
MDLFISAAIVITPDDHRRVQRIPKTCFPKPLIDELLMAQR